MADGVLSDVYEPTIAATNGDTARARLSQATADDFQRNVESWTVTTTGNSAAAGSADGYGDCYQPSQGSCTTGAPWPPTGTGTGHLWPNLSGERAESDLAEGNTAGAESLLQAMINFSSGVGLVPAQAWEDPDLAASPFGSDPATASIGFTDGQAAGSASPLTWDQAQELRLILSLGARKNVDTPAVTTARYITSGAPAVLPMTISTPTSGSTLASSSVAVIGVTTPNAAVTVESADTTTGAPPRSARRSRTVTATSRFRSRSALATT